MCGSFPPLSLPLFHCVYSVTGACSPYCVGAHGWVARICQPWEQSSSRSWLPIVEAPGCFRHPTSILAMQLLTDVNNCRHLTNDLSATKRLSKRESPTTVLFRTTLTRTITQYELLILLGLSLSFKSVDETSVSV